MRQVHDGLTTGKTRSKISYSCNNALRLCNISAMPFDSKFLPFQPDIKLM